MPVSAQDPITELLKKAKAIAVVGLSNSPLRASYGVSAYMQTQGYRIIPVNPNLHEPVLGEAPYASLRDVPEGIDIVDIVIAETGLIHHAGRNDSRVGNHRLPGGDI